MHCILQYIDKQKTTPHFHFSGNFYEQNDGTAMGSPLSPIVTNIFMEGLEVMTISTADLQPKLWKRYVDDTFVIWPHGRDSLDEFLQHINSLHDRIKFTMEVESEGKIAFLDVQVERKGFRLITSVYRKPTHTDRYLNYRYLNYRSNHHPRTKMGIISCLKKRAFNICSDRYLHKELCRLQDVFQANGFPTYRVTCTIWGNQYKSEGNNEENEEEKEKTLVLPYVRGLSEAINRTCKTLGVETAFTSKPTLRSLLTQVKSKIPIENKVGVIYEIPCECGAVYVGETGRNLKTRVEEHQKAVKKGDMNNALSCYHTSIVMNIYNIIIPPLAIVQTGRIALFWSKNQTCNVEKSKKPSISELQRIQ